MLIIFRIAMALFIGFGPIFILCLLFKKTAPLFQKWLYYGLATIFSGVLLGVMAEISMDLASKVATSLFITDTASYIITGEGAAGVMQAATQQLGLGLILSTLLIIVPPMAGLWFNGMMGSFTPYSAFSGWNPQSASSGGMGGSSQVAGALPPGIAGGAQPTPIRQQQNSAYNNTNTNSMAPINNTIEYVNNSETGTNVNSNQVKTFEQAKQSAVKVNTTSKD
jgi:virB6 protein